MRRHLRYLSVLAVAWMAAGCMTAQSGMRPAGADSPARNFCPERLPVAQDRIRNMYASQRAGRGHDVEAEVVGPDGTRFSVGVSADFLGNPGRYSAGPQYVRTGLADLVFNCGSGGFSDKECFIDVYLDGREITSMSPTTEGQVPIQCLPAGRHELVIKSVATTIYQGTIYLESDVEHLAKVEKLDNGEYRFEIYARNPIPGRIPEYRPRYRPDRHGDRDDHRRHRRPMSEGDFEDLVDQVDEAAFADEQLGVIRMAARHNWFTAEQVRQLVQEVSGSDAKVEVAVNLYDRTVDRNRFHRVMSAFNFSSSRREVRERLGL